MKNVCELINLNFSEMVEIEGGSPKTEGWGRAIGEFMRGILDGLTGQ